MSEKLTIEKTLEGARTFAKDNGVSLTDALLTYVAFQNFDLLKLQVESTETLQNISDKLTRAEL